MEEKENFALLDLLLQPGFCVEENRITRVNAAAQSLLLTPGMDIAPLLQTGAEEYAAFTDGCLYLRLNLEGASLDASVTRMGQTDIFVLDPEEADSELQALSLAARELRYPLTDLTAITENLLPRYLNTQDPVAEELLARMSQGIYRLQRLLGNMSDAAQPNALGYQEVRNLAQIFEDVFVKAAALLEPTGVTLRYDGLPRDVWGLIDAAQMERAVLNLISNAVKYLPPQGHLHASLTQSGKTLRLTLTDNGSGLGPGGLGLLNQPYLRQPGLEDPRRGLGLGLVLVRAAATNHGGAVLIDQPPAGGTRVTLTMRIRPAAQTQVRSPIADLTGGRDQALIELSEVLPLSAYKKELLK